MLSSIDGRIVVDRWPPLGESRQEYERTAATFESDGWMCGRVTMEPFARGMRDTADVERDKNGQPTQRDDFVAPDAEPPVAVAIDAHGKLAWESNDIDGDHVVTVLSERVSDDYLAFLRERGVSYLFAPSSGDELHLGVALEKLADRFGVRTLLLEGGGGVNGSMLRDGLVDEISLLVAPIADGGVGTATVFDADGKPRRLTLSSIDRRPGEIIWLRYRVDS